MSPSGKFIWHCPQVNKSGSVPPAVMLMPPGSAIARLSSSSASAGSTWSASALHGQGERGRKGMRGEEKEIALNVHRLWRMHHERPSLPPPPQRSQAWWDLSFIFQLFRSPRMISIYFATKPAWNKMERLTWHSFPDSSFPLLPALQGYQQRAILRTFEPRVTFWNSSSLFIPPSHSHRVSQPSGQGPIQQSLCTQTSPPISERGGKLVCSKQAGSGSLWHTKLAPPCPITKIPARLSDQPLARITANYLQGYGTQDTVSWEVTGFQNRVQWEREWGTYLTYWNIGWAWNLPLYFPDVK